MGVTADYNGAARVIPQGERQSPVAPRVAWEGMLCFGACVASTRA